MANHGVSVPDGAPPLVRKRLPPSPFAPLFSPSQSHAAQESWVIGFLSGASEPAINRRGIPGPGPLLPASKPGSSCQGTDCWGAQEVTNNANNICHQLRESRDPLL
ncbi:unnamed protein product [Gadus morhua 'NCC']